MEAFNAKSDAAVTRDLLRRGKASVDTVLAHASSPEYLKKPPERWTDTDTVRLCLGGTDFVRLWRRCINNGLPEEAEVELPEMLRFMRSAARWWF